jgi:hypothetical protein
MLDAALGGADRPADPSPRPQLFDSGEEAWFWTMAALAVRRDGARFRSPVPRPCRPEDILKCLDRLYRCRRIDLLHVRILRIWGERQMAPNPATPRERCDSRIWDEAIDRLEWKLRAKGYVRGLT